MSAKATSTRKVSNSSIIAGGIPAMAITNVYITDSSYNVLDDTAISNTGGYIRILGVGFLPGYSLYLNGIAVASSTYVSTGEIRAVTPSIGNGSYNLTLFNTNNTGAIYSLTFSGFPTWTTGSYVSNTSTINVQLLATGDGTLNYYLQSGSTLPTGVTLSSTGLLSGSISGGVSGTVYSFTVLVDDAQLQTSQQAISLTLSFNDTYWKNTSLMLTGETSVTPFINDASTNNFGLTIAGDTKPTIFTPYQGDGYYSVYFYSSSDFLNFPSSYLPTVASTAFTLEFWVYPTTTTIGVSASIISSGNIELNLNNGGTAGQIRFDLPSGVTNVINSGTTYVTFGAWNHIALTRTAGNAYTLYLNGVNVGTGSSSTAITTLNAFGNKSASPLNGLISQLRVSNNVRYAANFTPSTIPLTADSNTTLLTCQSNSFVDKSVNSLALTTTGAPKISQLNPFGTPTSVTVNTGNSVYFSGTQADSFTVAGSTAFNIASAGSWTIETWIYCTGLAGNLRLIACKDWSPGTTYASFGFSVLAANTLSMSIGSGTSSSTANQTMNGTATISLNTWYHVAFVANASTYTIYINGAVDATGSITGTVGVSSNNVLLGVANNGYQFQGYISNFRIVKSAVYTSAFTPSTSPLIAIANTQLLTFQGSQVVDTSTNAYVLTPTNTPKVLNNAYPFTQTTATVSNLSVLGSAYFDGTGDYLTLPSGNASLQLTSSDFTLEAWVYPTTFVANGNPVFALDVNGSWYPSVRFGYESAGAISLYMSTTGSSFAINVSSGIGTMVLNAWQHMALSRSGTSVRVFLNGVQQGSTQTLSGALMTSTNNWIGYLNAPSTQYVNGYISDARITKTALYTSNFAPTYQPLTAITNTQLLTLQYKGGANNYGIIDTSPINNILTRYGNATQGSFSPYSVTGYSNYFNGTTDYLSITSNAAFAFGTGDFTIEFWVYPTTTSAQYWFDLNDATNRLLIFYNGTNIVYYFNPGGSTLISGGAPTFNAWNHIALSRVSGSTKMFLNGAQIGSTYADTKSYIAMPLYIGKDGAAATYITGYMSNVRVVKGTGVYTTAFTPSTTPPTPITNTSLLTCQSNRFIDNSPSNLTVTPSGTISVQALSPFGSISEATPLSYSTYFNGSSTTDYLTIAHNTALNLVSGDFTIEAWVFRVELASNLGVILGKDGVSGSTYPSYMLYLTYPSSDYRVNFQVGNGTNGVTVQTITSSVALPLGQWVHVAATRSTTTLTLWQNGVSVATATQTITMVDGSKALLIGYQTSGPGTQVWSGYISNVRIIKGNAIYLATFAPSTIPLTAIVNTQLLTCQSSTIIDNSTNNFTVRSGSTAGLTRVYKYNPFGYTAQSIVSYNPTLHGGSMYFDGTGDYLTAVNSKSFDLTGGKWTIECWFYQTSAKLAQLFSISSAQWRLNVAADGSGNFVFNGNQSMAYPAGSFPPGQWNHMSASFFNDGTGTQQRCHANGKLVGVGQYGPTADTSSLFYIGNNSAAAGAWDFNGYITDLRIIKGDCLYYDSFVPPSTPLTVTPNTVFFANGTNGGIIDQHSSNVLETVGNAQLSTSIKKYGVSSMSFNGSTQYMIMPASPNFTLGSGDFTIEMWVYLNATGPQLTDWRPTTTNGVYPTLYMSTNFLRYYVSSADRITGATSLSISTWYHVAVSRASGSTKMFLNGVQEGSTYTDSNTYVGTTVTIGASGYDNTVGRLNGYIDDLRITKGFARYTANFSAPTITQPIL